MWILIRLHVNVKVKIVLVKMLILLMVTLRVMTLYPLAFRIYLVRFESNVIYLYFHTLGVASPSICQSICLLTSTCAHFTWQEGNFCYLVETPYWLEHDSDKISGSRDCVQLYENKDSVVSPYFS